MGYRYRDVCIVRIVDTSAAGQTSAWFVGPYGSTRADQAAGYLESVGTDSDALKARQCFVEPLYADDECLHVADYSSHGEGTLQ